MVIKLSDINDTPPKFSRSRYSSVVPENSVEGTLVVQVVAVDPDLGPSGEVVYDFADAKSKVDIKTLSSVEFPNVFQNA